MKAKLLCSSLIFCLGLLPLPSYCAATPFSNDALKRSLFSDPLRLPSIDDSVNVTHNAVQNVSTQLNSTLSNLQNVPYPSNPNYVEHLFLGLARVIEPPGSPYENATLHRIQSISRLRILPDGTAVRASADLRDIYHTRMYFRWIDPQGDVHTLAVHAAGWGNWFAPFLTPEPQQWSRMRELSLDILEETAGYFEWERVSERLAERENVPPPRPGLRGPWSHIELVWAVNRLHPCYGFFFPPRVPLRPFVLNIVTGQFSFLPSLDLAANPLNSTNLPTVVSDFSGDEFINSTPGRFFL